MKIVNYLIIALMSLILASCSKVADPVKSFGIGSKNLNYESDQSVESLIIPPDLTAPSSQSSFTNISLELLSFTTSLKIPSLSGEVKFGGIINESTSSED